MHHPEPVSSCVAPGAQPVLFHVPSSRVPVDGGIDRRRVEKAGTTGLGVAVTLARRVLAEQSEVWIRASDDTTARIDPQRVASDTPSCPWIQTIAEALEATP